MEGRRWEEGRVAACRLEGKREAGRDGGRNGGGLLTKGGGMRYAGEA